ncbi:hypothetical protein [Gemmatimonas aurantiaca]|uniref:hypothetical protein n=1 Tax=Gemmatimonas aurantiaca TaxID=173480 RepID=UPI00301D4120
MIPRFITDWFKTTGATPYIRNSIAPNRRAQDGPKLPLFCDSCEQLLGKDEKIFAETIFHPLNSDHGAIIPYGPWLARFCVGLSLRVALFYERDGSSQLDSTQKAFLTEAVAIWRKFLLGTCHNLGPFEQHFLPLDILLPNDDPDLPPNFNLYLARSLDIDVVGGRNTAFVFAKPGPFCVLGLIQRAPTKIFLGTKVNLNGGTIMPREYAMPGQFRLFLIAKARKVAAIAESMSQKQKDGIIAEVAADPERLENSDTARAIAADLRMRELRDKKPGS